MDTLAQSLTGVLIGNCIVPKLASSHRTRFFIATTLIVNLPDIDILFGLHSTDMWLFNHQGLSHSFIALLLWIPLGIGLFHLIMAEAITKYQVSFLQRLVFVSLAIICGHYLLDYLTSYGMKLFSPFNDTKFSYPLFFVIDPIYSIFLGTVLFFSWKKPLYRYCSTTWVSVFGMIFILSWGGISYGFKKQAEQKYTHYVKNTEHRAIGNVSAYTLLLSPFLWLIIEQQTNNDGIAEFEQGVISFLPSMKNDGIWYAPFSSPNRQAFCPGKEITSQTVAAWTQYHRWAEKTVCDYFLYQGEKGCRCIPLKYSIAPMQHIINQSYWISMGDRHKAFFLPGEDSNPELERTHNHLAFIPDPIYYGLIMPFEIIGLMKK